MSRILTSCLLICLFTLTTSTQLLYPVDPKLDEWCGPFKECPKGTQCMKLFDRSEPFSCFLPRFGSTFSFIENQNEKNSDTGRSKSYFYEPLPLWLLASASFGILCAATFSIWSGFFVARRFILFVFRLRCPKNEEKMRKREEANLGYCEPEDV